MINIITKDPERYNESFVTARAGTLQLWQGRFRYSGRLTERLSASFTGGYHEYEGASGANDFHEISKLSGRVKYRFSDDSVLHFFTILGKAERGIPLSVFTPSIDSEGDYDHQALRWEKTISRTSRFHLQVFRKYYDIDSDELDTEEQEYGVELQHSFSPGTGHQLVWGLHYYRVYVDSSYLRPTTDHDNTFSCFLQDEFRLSDTLKFIAGLNFENNSFTGSSLSPRACLLYELYPGHHLRFSFARAFQTPSFAKDSLLLTKELPSPLPPITAAALVGNRGLDTEDMIAYELGYRTVLFDRLGLNVELYYNDIDDVVTEVLDHRFMWPLRITWDNVYNAIAKGVEVAVDLPVTSWWKLHVNYTYQEVEKKRDNRDVPGTPRHKINLSSSVTFENGFSFDVRAHYVDDTTWRPVLGEPVRVDDYVRLDIRIAQKLLNDRLELALVGQNLTDKTHPETSDGTATYNAHKLIYGQVTWHFK